MEEIEIPTNNRYNLIIKALKMFEWHTLLDLGSADKYGMGLHNTLVANFPDKTVIGMDKKDNDNVDIVCDLNAGITYKDSGADVIVAGEIIEHLQEPFFFLKECHRALKTGGILILTTPNATGLDTLFGSDYTCHLHLWTLPMIRRNIESAGFEIMQCRYTSYWNRNIVFRMLAAIFPRYSTNTFIMARCIQQQVR